MGVRLAEGEAQLVRVELAREQHRHQVGDRLRPLGAGLREEAAALGVMGGEPSAVDSATHHSA